MFKLLSIRPLIGCDVNICKCLKIGMMYYFCNDYQIVEHSRKIVRTSRNLKTLRNDFFSVRPEINISAIVGMNGDGKSSIIELMMRLTNNCAITYSLVANPDNLRLVRRVVAELYYMVDDKVYIMKGNADGETMIWEIADLSDHTHQEWNMCFNEPLRKTELPESFFFTIVSNYSHYAYNIYDFYEEWDEHGGERNDSEKCWLHYVFHKNDGYLTPMTLHPYRDRGNINVNREKALSKQRLLSLFLNADNPQLNPQSFRRVNGKDAEFLVLKELDYSKLQQSVLIEELKARQTKIKLTAVLNQIAKVDNNDEGLNRVEYNNLIESALPYMWEEPIEEVVSQGEDFVMFVKNVVQWLDRNAKKVFPGSGDFRRVLSELGKLSVKYHEEIPEINVYHGRYGAIYGFLKKLSAAQVGRLDTIYRIMKKLDVSPDILTTPFEHLTLNERLLHYKIYKVVSIIETYPQYQEILGDEYGNNRIREYGPELEACVDKVLLDRETHVSRKIRQIDNFINEGLEDGGLYERLGDWDDKHKNLIVEIERLKEHYHGNEISTDQLPPAIYEWDIVFRRENDNNSFIRFDSFSSGEKQFLNSLGAIIYHLQNLETSSTIRYPSVNLILEEIELYYHPECQRQFIQKMLELIKGLRLDNIRSINVIFVTHSPFILSDIPKCNVLFLKDGVAQNTMQENTFGANIHSLLKNGFFLPNLPMGEFAYQKINHLFYLLNSGDFNPETDLEDIFQQILLVGEPFLRSQLLGLYHAYKGM